MSLFYVNCQRRPICVLLASVTGRPK